MRLSAATFRGLYANRSDRNISSSSKLRRFSPSGTGAAAESACRERPHTNVGGFAGRQVVCTNQNASHLVSRGKSITPPRGKPASRGFGRAPGGARTTTGRRFSSPFDSRRTLDQHIFAASYFEAVSGPASRREGERTIR